MFKSKRAFIIAILLAFVLGAASFAGCGIKITDITGGTPRPAQSQNISQDSQLGIQTIEQAWSIILEDFVDKDNIDTGKLSAAAIKGMVEALDDPYTVHLPAETFKLSLSDIHGSFEGIGAYLGYRDDELVIIAPIADSPADRAGIKPGDRLLEVDGLPTADMSIDEVVLHVRGPKGTTVSLLVQHQGEAQPVRVDIVRDEIELTSAFLEMRGDIAYLRILTFTDRTDDELEPLLKQIQEAKAKGIVLDLRSNPGGLLTSVVDVASRFIPSGVILYVEDNESIRTPEKASPRSRTTDLPIVALTDNYTASAAEVLAGALQDHQRAVIAGTSTFGKGSVQTLFTLQDESGLKITSAHWLTPNQRLIQKTGIMPDYKLSKDTDPVQWAIDFLHSQE